MQEEAGVEDGLDVCYVHLLCSFVLSILQVFIHPILRSTLVTMLWIGLTLEGQRKVKSIKSHTVMQLNELCSVAKSVETL